MNNIQNLRNEVIEALAREGISAQSKNVVKNGVVNHGVAVSTGSVSPCFYLEDFANLAVEEIVKAIKNRLANDVFVKTKRFSVEDIDINNVTLFVTRGEADNVVLRPFIDGLFYGVKIIANIPGGTGGIKLTKSIAEAFGKSVDELFDLAAKNLRQGARIQPMEEVIARIQGVPVELIRSQMPCPNFMFVASDKYDMDGGAILTDTETLHTFWVEHGDFWIIPSSVHELIFVPCGSTGDNNEGGSLSPMIRDVNESMVSPAERLSNNLFKYSNACLKIFEA